MQPPIIYFYLPKVYWDADDRFPHLLEKYQTQAIDSDLWEWHVATHPSLKSDGLFAWVIQPYLYLRAGGFDCQLVSELPQSGIVIVPRKFVPEQLRPGRNLLIVMLKADCKLHKYAQIHIIENLNEQLKHTTDMWESHFIPHFPQPGLRPRNADRSTFENIAYFGLETNLAKELSDTTWSTQLQNLGLNWSIRQRDRWHDYSDIDAIVAVRSFQTQGYDWKPATKLSNAWHAGVPAILGRESAYQNERKSRLDYIEVSSVDEAIAALQKLQAEPKLRQAMIDNGRKRAERTQPQEIARQWQNFLLDTAVPAYYRWCETSPLSQQSYALVRYLAMESRGLRSQTRRVQGQIKSAIKSML
jgi:hypothetical protein